MLDRHLTLSAENGDGPLVNAWWSVDLGTHASNAGDLGLIPGQGVRFSPMP